MNKVLSCAELKAKFSRFGFNFNSDITPRPWNDRIYYVDNEGLCYTKIMIRALQLSTSDNALCASDSETKTC